MKKILKIQELAREIKTKMAIKISIKNQLPLEVMEGEIKNLEMKRSLSGQIMCSTILIWILYWTRKKERSLPTQRRTLVLLRKSR